MLFGSSNPFESFDNFNKKLKLYQNLVEKQENYKKAIIYYLLKQTGFSVKVNRDFYFSLRYYYDSCEPEIKKDIHRYGLVFIQKLKNDRKPTFQKIEDYATRILKKITEKYFPIF